MRVKEEVEAGCKLHSSITTSAFTYVSEDSLYLALPRPLAVLLYKATHRNKHEASMKLGRDGGVEGRSEVGRKSERRLKKGSWALTSKLHLHHQLGASVVAFSSLKASRATVLSFLHKVMV